MLSGIKGSAYQLGTALLESSGGSGHGISLSGDMSQFKATRGGECDAIWRHLLLTVTVAEP